MRFLTCPLPLYILLGGAVLAWIAGWFGHIFWFVDLFSHFQLHFLAGTLILSLIAYICRERRTAAACIVFAVCIMAGLITLAPPRISGTDCKNTLKLVSFNVLTPNLEMNQVVEFLRAEQPDIIALYEINNIFAFALRPLLKYYPYNLVQPSSDNFGIALYSRVPLTNIKLISTASWDIPMIRADLGDTLILATHTLPPAGKARTGERNATLQAVEDALAENPARPAIVMGDWNATPWSSPLRAIIKHTGLQSARANNWAGTWPSQWQWLGIPIDHIFTRGYACGTTKTGPDLGSDHRPLIAVLGIN